MDSICQKNLRWLCKPFALLRNIFDWTNAIGAIWLLLCHAFHVESEAPKETRTSG